MLGYVSDTLSSLLISTPFKKKKKEREKERNPIDFFLPSQTFSETEQI